MTRFAALVLSLVMIAFMAPVRAADKGSPDEAKAMAVKAAEYLKANGPEKSFAVFQAKEDGAFHDRDLYVFVLDNTGKMLSHGANAVLIGKSLVEVKDVDGKPFTREMLAIKDADWVSYKWQNPVTKAVEPKAAYVVRVGDSIVGVGAYAN